MASNTSMGFAGNLVPLILDGTKTLTYRIGDEYDFLEIGDEIDVRDSSNENVFGKIKITEKSYTTFADLPINRNGHEVYKNKQEQRETFEKYYGQIDDKDKMLVLGFSLVGKY